MDTGFDIAASAAAGRRGRGARGRLYPSPRHGRANPVPVVPVFLNTYYPPNQPRPRPLL